MELQLAVQSARSNGRNHIGNTAKAIPNYLKPSTGSCHHVCKYGGTHTFEEKEAHRAQPKPRKQPPVSDHQKIRVRLVPRKLFGDRSRGNEKVENAGADKEKKLENVEWKHIVAYDTVPAHGSLPVLDVKKDVMRGKKSHDKAENPEQADGVRSQNESLDRKLVNKSVGSKMMTSSKVSTEPTHKNMNTDTKSERPPRGKKPTVLVAKKKADIDQELVDRYQPLSPSLLQKRASLLRDLEEEMVHESTIMNEFKATYSLDQEEYAAAETSRPVPAHRRVKSMSISSGSVRFPFPRQASKNLATFKLQSKSSKGPILPSEEEKPSARLSRSRRGSVGGSDDIRRTGRGIQLRIRSLRRRGVGGSGGASTGFVVPAVSLRHQKTLKKRSQRLYNNMIEETASKLVKTRKSRVKALVGAFESVISKIAK